MSASVFPEPLRLLPGIGDLGQGCRSSERRTSRHVIVCVRRCRRVYGHADQSPVDNVSFAGAAASDSIGTALFSTDLILFHEAFSDRHLDCYGRWHDANRVMFPLTAFGIVPGTEN